MPRTTEKLPLSKHTMFLYEGDLERLRTYYPDIGASIVVRRLIRQYLTKLDRKMNDEETVEVQINL